MVSTRPFISKSFCPFINPLVTVPRAQIIIDINVTFMFYSFFNSLAKSRYLSFFHCLSILLYDKVHNFLRSFVLLLLLIIITSGRLPVMKSSVWMSKSLRSLYVLFSRTNVGLCIYYLFVWSNFTFLHNSKGFTLPTQSCLVLYSFCANLML